MGDDGIEIVLILGAIALAVAAYVGFCHVVLAYVLVPSFPFLVLGGGVLGALLVLGDLVATLLSLGPFVAPRVTPTEGMTRLPKSRTKFDRDRAWPNYLFAQSRNDLSTALKHMTTSVERVWQPAAKLVGGQPGILIGWPLLLLPLVLMLALTGGVIAASVAAFSTIGAVLCLAWAGWQATTGALRGVDMGVRRLRGAKATCSLCHYRNLLPAYRCSCGEMHHDIRAGRLGTFARRCDCGRLLPTTVLKAISGLTPHCQDCGHPLRGNAGAVTDISLPVFGPASAGKTRLVYAGMVALERHVAAVGGKFSTIDAHSEQKLNEAKSIVGARVETAKTQENEPRVNVTLLLAHGQREAFLHLSDAAGELFTSREQNGDLRFLDDTEGLMFVLDPFSIPAVRDELKGAFAPVLAAANPADMDPEQSYLVTSQRLCDQGIKLKRKALAVVVVKSDLLSGLPCAGMLGSDPESDSIQNWLSGLGLDNFVSGAERDFEVVRYFLVSSFDDKAGPDGTAAETSAAQPLLWLLGKSKMPLPVRTEVGVP